MPGRIVAPGNESELFPLPELVDLLYLLFHVPDTLQALWKGDKVPFLDLYLSVLCLHLHLPVKNITCLLVRVFPVEGGGGAFPGAPAVNVELLQFLVGWFLYLYF